jgi:dUTP pyrophosphatase
VGPSEKVFSYFCKIHPDAIIPTYATIRSVGCDLYCCEDITINPNNVGLVRTGLIVKPPMGYWYEICIRSSIPVKNPGLVLANGVGIIDPDYTGPNDEVKVAILNTSNKECKFIKGHRIAQLILREALQPGIEEIFIDQVTKSSRGGFGSSGS